MKRQQRLLWGPGASELHAHALKAAQSKAASEWLHEKRYKPQHSQLSYRVLNDWTEKNLVEDDRASESQGWRTFSIKDLLWIKALMTLRSFGLSQGLLKETKRSLGIGKESAYPVMETAIMLCVKRYPMFLAVFEDGHAELATASCLAFSDTVLGPQSYLRINLNTLFRELIGDRDGKYSPKLPAHAAISPDEVDVIETLREQGIDEILIEKRRGKITAIESTKHIDGPASLIEQIKDIGYGSIATKVEAGKQSHTKIVKRRKLN